MTRGKRNFLLTLWLTLLPIAVSAEANLDNHNWFEIKPRICIGEQDATCVTGLEFIWRLAQPQHICVRNPEQALFCTDEQQGHRIEQVELDQVTEYTLYSPDNRFTPLRRQVKVLFVGKDVRLRRKHPWSVF